jgi:hypothetical protein
LQVLSWENVQVGQPGPGQVRIRHTAIGLNFIDVYFRTGVYKCPLPHIPGKLENLELQAAATDVLKLSWVVLLMEFLYAFGDVDEMDLLDLS